MANIEYSERPVHFTRVLDFIIAAANRELGINTTENLAAKEFKLFADGLQKSEERFREIVTKNTPAIYLVDFKDIAATIRKTFDKNTTIESLKYTDVEGQEQTIDIDYKKDVSTVVLNSDALAVAADSPGFEEDLIKWLHNDFYGITNDATKFRKKRAGIQNLVVQEFEKSFLGIVPITEKQASVEFLPIKSISQVDTIVETAHEMYIKEIAEAESKPGPISYTAYENAAIKAGRYLTIELKKIGTFLELDVSKIVSGTSKNTHALVVSNTFNSAQENVNKILQPSIVNFLSSRLKEAIQDVIKLRYKGAPASEKYFNIGNIINAGHTAAFVGNTSLGVNMPSAQKVSCLVEYNTAQNLDKALSNLYFDLNYTVNFTQDYRSKISKYVGFQFAMVVTMPAALNTKGLNRAEQSLVKNFAGRITRDFNKVLANKTSLWVKEALAPRAANTSASETLIQAGLSELFSIFDPVKYKPVRFAKPNEANKKAKTPAKVKLNIKPIKVQTSSGRGGTIKAGGASSKTAAIPPKGITSQINLPMLMMQINSNLHDQIKRNMGTGNRRDVLNYRTGRFAQSAKVERLSESRQGMITAFYSYMKNPYATFSSGGRQERPFSRDPKTLISKSIRELAGQQVANRMRAVLV